MRKCAVTCLPCCRRCVFRTKQLWARHRPHVEPGVHCRSSIVRWPMTVALSATQSCTPSNTLTHWHARLTVTLELRRRRLHLDLIVHYKIVFSLVSVHCTNFLQLSPSSHTRGHTYKLYKLRSLTSSLLAQHFLATELLTCGITYHMMQMISPH